METSIYRINKGINRPLEFKGLRAQYISYLAAGLVFLLLIFTLLYLVGLPLLLCLAIIFLSGITLFTGIYYLNRKFGQYGLLKKLAGRSTPSCIRIRSRKIFQNLTKQETQHGQSN